MISGAALFARPAPELDSSQRRLGPAQIDILTFADFHGRVDPPQYSGNANEPGAARFVAYAEWLRSQNPNPNNVLTISGGDEFHGYALSNISMGETVVSMMNYLTRNQSYNMQLALGNHEYSFGPGHPITLGQEVTLLASDIFYASDAIEVLGDLVTTGPGQRPSYVRPYAIVNFPDHDITIGLVGLMNSSMRTLISGGMAGYDLRTPLPGGPEAYNIAVDEIINTLRNTYRVNAVIAVTHMGGNSEEINHVARRFDVDAIIGGHYHARVNRYETVIRNGIERQIPIVEAGQHGQSIGRISLSFNDQGRLENAEHWISPVNAIRDFGNTTETQSDFAAVTVHYNAVEAIIQNFRNQYAEYFNFEIGPSGVYYEDRAGRDFWITRLVLDYVVNRLGDNNIVMISNSGGWRNTGLWPRNADSPVTRQDMYSSMPFNNAILLFQMYGRDLIYLLNGAPDMPHLPPPLGPLAAQNMMASVNTGAHMDANGIWYVTATGQRITDNDIYTVIGSNFIWGGIGQPGGDRFPFPGNAHGNASGMTFIAEPIALLTPTAQNSNPTMPWSEFIAMASTDSSLWEGYGARMLRNALEISTAARRAPISQWAARLNISSTGRGSAEITSPYAPGNKTSSLNINPTWVTVSATPSAGASFLGWFSGTVEVSRELNYSFVIREDTNLEARFNN